LVEFLKVSEMTSITCSVDREEMEAFFWVCNEKFQLARS
jgi:hypothetical protein